MRQKLRRQIYEMITHKSFELITEGANNSDVFDIAEIIEDQDISTVLADIEPTILVECYEVWTSNAVCFGQQSAEMLATARHQVHAVAEEVCDKHVVERVTADR